MDAIDSRLETLADRRLDALAEARALPSALRDALRPLATASDFAIETLVRRPALVDARHAMVPPPALDPADPEGAMAALRRWRAAASTVLVARDVDGLDAVDATLAGSTRIAEHALHLGLAQAEAELAPRFGRVRDAEGREQRLVVFALGKLGGGELNFSSDVDLVYAYARGGASDGPRVLDAEPYFVRVGQRLAQLLGDVTADGFSHRVDLRLRPFGDSGRLALSFDAMEAYFQRDGRDWERYAWLKARPVAGDLAAGDRMVEALRPFVYRRYLDFTALDALREMKAMIEAEVARRDMADDLKRGPGGIREVEFLVQALQLIRGGREPALRRRGLLPALSALAAAGHLPEATAQRLAEAYRFLRRVENRVQMLRDAQTYALPDDPLDRLRIARGLAYADAAGLEAALQAHRDVVSAEFAAVLGGPRRGGPEPAVEPLAAYWAALPDAGEPAVLAAAGFADAGAADEALRRLAGSALRRGLSPRAAAWFDRIVPLLLAQAAASTAPDASLMRGIALLTAIGRRSSYFALLAEQPAALERLAQVCAGSALLAERLTEHPLLLDELLDVRAAGPLPDAQAVVRDRAVGLVASDDAEAALLALNERRHSLAFRIGLAWRAGRLDAIGATRALAAVAEGVVGVALGLAEREVARAHGRIAGGGFAVLGYGSIGAEELGFASDLDLVFVHGADPQAVSDGPRPLDAGRYYLRVAQKFVALLDTATPAGKLYDVDARLRPAGAKGLLVVGAAGFAQYQHERAWTWEHQALVRMRPLAGEPSLLAALGALREAVLARPRDPATLAREVADMRERMRRELDRSDEGHLDLKQGRGGLVDLEFLLQHAVLREAGRVPALLSPRHSDDLLAALGDAGLWPIDTVRALRDAHARLVEASLACTLDRRPRRARRGDPQLEAACAAVASAWSTLGPGA
ncbi:MAG: bifunctional [glutamate--ammonia ligase]-adenylyl-L-tyrosine phosphorylase/[glutamate--ammonia-ligase] adenylyltransferase [Xanthomonadaceae bacterium]|nr:bifunctional [glutamate--ammonia ligase]-adenylyl-L-tyrosine phosphorylase/[glutamate--ammonia-ligase] adenylyltransferase [Xanthomonadaceae bacterium]